MAGDAFERKPHNPLHRLWDVLGVIALLAVIALAIYGNKAHAAAPRKEPAGCQRTVRSDTVSVACKLSGIVQYSFMARSTRPGARISHTYVCDTAAPSSGAGGIDAPAYAERTVTKTGSYYDRIRIRVPDWSTWICTIEVSVDTSPSPIRPQLEVSFLRAIRA